jgi:purine-binding chemotaxis protein CheW
LNDSRAELALLCRSRARILALPLSRVAETMRPLPLEPLPGAPPFVTGVSVIRAAPVPVVDAALLLGGGDSHPRRLVTLTVGDRRVALAVDEVLGVRPLAAEALAELPPLLREAGSGVVEAIGTLDTELLLVLRSARLVPESVLAGIGGQGG